MDADWIDLIFFVLDHAYDEQVSVDVTRNILIRHFPTMFQVGVLGVFRAHSHSMKV